MSASPSSDSDSESQQSSLPTGRTSTRLFVWLQARTKSTPRGAAWDKLNRDGRVKEIAFSLNSSQKAMQSLVKKSFPGLEGADLTRIRMYRSINRGSSLERVAENIPDGKELLRLFGQSASKRVYMLLRGNHSVATSTSATTTRTVATSSATQTSSTVTTSATTLTSNTVATSAVTATTSTVATPAAAQTTALTLTTISVPVSTSASIVTTSAVATSAVAQTTAPTFTTSVTVSTPTSIATTTAVATAAVAQTTAPTLTTSVTVSTPASIATTTAGFIVPDNDDDDDDDDFLNIPASSSSWDVAGRILDDLSPVGVFSKACKVPYDQLDREHEVAWCENMLFKEGQDPTNNTSLPIFLNLSFNEMCQQANTDKSLMMLLVLKECDNLKHIKRLLALVKNMPDIYFWLAESGSHSGKRVKDKFGRETNRSEVFIMVPTKNQPILVERYCGKILEEVSGSDFLDSVKRAKESLNTLQSQSRGKICEQEGMLHGDQQLQSARTTKDRDEEPSHQPPKKSPKNPSDDQEKQIRQNRRQRITTVPAPEEEYYKIVLRNTNNGPVIGRRFYKTAFFQEVYDWAGAAEEMPLYFSIHRGPDKIMVPHTEPLRKHEVLSFVERDEVQMANLFKKAEVREECSQRMAQQ